VLVLAFDTSTPAVTVAVVDAVAGSRSVGLSERTEVATNRHGELLAPMIAASLRDAGVAPPDLTAIAVGLGPGPFTGLRVGIVTAKAMGDALRVPVYGAGSLDVLARRHHSGDTVAVLTDARRKQVYWAVYAATGERLEGPELGRPADVAEVLRGRARTVAGAGAVMYRDEFADFSLDGSDPYPRALDLVGVLEAKLSSGAEGDSLAPLYLRRPDAQPPGARKKVTPA
jgi:tRNA threonylcarbamoyladenosine biosynthesis protein TsaB